MSATSEGEGVGIFTKRRDGGKVSSFIRCARIELLVVRELDDGNALRDFQNLLQIVSTPIEVNFVLLI